MQLHCKEEGNSPKGLIEAVPDVNSKHLSVSPWVILLLFYIFDAVGSFCLQFFVSL